MPETAILNANVQWDKDIDDSIGPDYGWEQLRRSQLATIKPAFGRPWSRIAGNGGHTTTFSWVGRSRACVDKLKQWAEQYETGFFTVIDQEGGGRHYVGRFVGDMPRVAGKHDAYNVQGWQFEEIPGCPMLEYPADWDHWAVFEYPIDDFGDQLTATSSASWVRPAAFVDDTGASIVPRQLQNLTPAANDWITHEYRGYGCRLWAVQGPTFGLATVWIDGVNVAAIDLYNAALLGPQIVYENAQMPLDIHRVKVILSDTKNVASTGTGIVWDKLEVMR
jgi:hypothetical protein